MRADFTPGELTVHTDPAALSRVTGALRLSGRLVVLVPTMGALHAGHRELIRTATRTSNAVTVVSIFVNPLQFGPAEDLDRYPRSLDADLALCRQEGVELVFAPSVEAIYPPGSDSTVHPGPLGAELEGASRPGHFAGVLTVVAKLFGIVRPDQAFFGEKDYQQLVLISRMARDLHLRVRVIGVPTVREPDGLALSSRNAYLDAEQRAAASTIFTALVAGARAGASGPAAALSSARDVLRTEPALRVDYVELRSPDLAPAPPRGQARLLVAATVGNTRLIDNAAVRLAAGQSDAGPSDAARSDTAQPDAARWDVADGTPSPGSLTPEDGVI